MCAMRKKITVYIQFMRHFIVRSILIPIFLFIIEKPSRITKTISNVWEDNGTGYLKSFLILEDFRIFQ